MTADRPAEVDHFATTLAEWLEGFVASEPLLAEMAAACAAHAPWPAAIAAGAVRRAGWPDVEALAWGIAIGAMTGALEAAGRSLAGDGDGRADPGATADGPARALLAADGLVAAAHEAVAGLEPTRARAGLRALAGAAAAGGPWDALARRSDADWSSFVGVGLAAAAATDPDGPWAELVDGWSAVAAGDAVDPAFAALLAATAGEARPADSAPGGAA